MTDHEAKARAIAEEVLHGKFHFPALVPAIASALREAEAGEREACAKLATDIAEGCADGYKPKPNRCAHCRDGEIAASNTGFHIAAAIRRRNDE